MKLKGTDGGGIAGLRCDTNGHIVGGKLKAECVDASNLERKKAGLMGDKSEIYKTKLLRQYPFPEFEDEFFVTEAIMGNRMAADGYILRWFNKAIRVTEYYDDGLTKQGLTLFERNPIGWGLYIRQNKRFDQYSDQERDWITMYYYIVNRSVFESKEDLKFHLGVSDLEIQFFEKKIDSMKKDLREILGRRIGVYGLGYNGRLLMHCLRVTDLEVVFSMDKNKRVTDKTKILLDERIPDVDSIVVTPEKDFDHIRDFLQVKTQNRIVPFCDIKDIISKLFEGVFR